MRLKFLLGLFAFVLFSNIGHAQVIDTDKYYISDSDDPAGPSPAFIDIRTNGEFILGDERYEPNKVNFDLEKPFPFYNDTLERVSVSRFGYISGDLLDEGSDVDYCDKIGYDLTLPNEGLILVYHTTIRMFNNFGEGVWYRYFDECPVPKRNGEYMGASVFQWTGHEQASVAFKYNVEVILFDDGEILMQYDKDPSSLMEQPFYSSTTGLINPDRTTFDKHNCKKEEEDARFPFAVSFERRNLPTEDYCVNINGAQYSKSFDALFPNGDVEGQNDYFIDSFTVEGTGILIEDLSIRVEFQKDFEGNTIPLLGTRFFLQNSNTGRNIQLFNAGDNVLFNNCILNGGVNAVFTDSAPEKARCSNTSDNAIQGFLKPSEPLSTFKGIEFDGEWRLIIDLEPDSIATQFPPIPGSWCLVVDPLEEKDCTPADDVLFSNFNSGQQGWEASSLNGVNSWELATPSTPFLDNDVTVGDNSWVTNADGNYPNNESSQVISPSFDLNGFCEAFIEFDAAFDLENNRDGFAVQISEDGGSTWSNIGNFGDDNWYNVGALFVPVPGEGAGGQNLAHFSGRRSRNKYRHDLNDYIGKTGLQVRFVFLSSEEMVKEGIYFDNVRIGGSRPKIVEFDLDNNFCESEERIKINASPRGGDFTGAGIEFVDRDTFAVDYTGGSITINDFDTTVYTFNVDQSSFPTGLETYELNSDVNLEFLDMTVIHSAVSDMIIYLVTPNGDSTVLVDRIGTTSSNVNGCLADGFDVTFIRGNGKSIDSFCIDPFVSAVGNVTASNSDKGLQGLNGTAVGEYKIVVVDTRSGDAGSIENVRPTFIVNRQYYFNPQTAGVGSHLIDYEYTSFDSVTYFNSVLVRVFPQADATFSINENICIDQEVFDIEPVQEGGVFSGNGIIDAEEGLFDANVAGLGEHTITYILDVANSCNDTFSQTVKVDYGVIAEAGDNVDDICFGTPIQLGGNPTAMPDPRKTNPSFFFTYEWMPESGFVDANGSTEANPTVTPGEDVTYTVKVTDTFGCFAFDTVSITTIRNKPFANAGDDQLLCIGNSISLGGNPTAEGGVAPYTFDWRLIDSTFVSNERNPDVSPTETSTYVLYLSDIKGCTDSDTVQITVVPNPTVEIDRDTAICAGSSVEFTAIVTSGSGPYTYNWTPTIGLNSFNSQSVIATASNLSAIYFVEVTDANGCTATDDVNLTTIAAPEADAGDDHEMCDNLVILNQADTVRLPILGGSPAGTPSSVLYEWAPRSDIYNDNYTVPNPRVRQLTSTTVFTLVVTDPVTGCTDSDQTRIVVNQSPVLNLDEEEKVCKGSSVELGAVDMVSGGVPAYSYTWLPARTLDDPTKPNPKATPDQDEELYTVYVTDSKGCTQIGQVTVTTINPQVGSFNNLPFEVCQNDMSVILSANPPGGSFSGDGVENGLFNPFAIDSNSLANVTYEVFDGNGCFVSVTREIFVKDAPELTVSSDTTIYKRDSAYLFAFANVAANYSWEPAVSIKNPKVSNPTVFPMQTTTYTVFATAANGCVGEEYVNVIVEAQPAILGIPNTFTPNGDGKNDQWIIEYLDDFPINNVQVYNRWGQLVFEQADYNNASPWDGGDLPEEVYYYIISVGENDKNPHRGYVTIVK